MTSRGGTPVPLHRLDSLLIVRATVGYKGSLPAPGGCRVWSTVEAHLGPQEVLHAASRFGGGRRRRGRVGQSRARELVPRRRSVGSRGSVLRGRLPRLEQAGRV